MKTFSTLFFIVLIKGLMFSTAFSQENNQKHDFQIALPRPAKVIRLLMYEKNFVPIQGNLSEDKKSIIIKNYEKGSKVHVKVEYEDGTVEEFVKSPCYIDPVIS